MKSLIIKPHSFIDVITNSSTEIYCNAKDKAVDMVKEVINKVLKDSGSDKSFDDLYNIGYIAGDSIERLEDEDMDSHGFTPGQLIKFRNGEILDEAEMKALKEYSEDNSGDYLSIKVVSKDGEQINFAHLFDIFEYEEGYD